MRKRACLAVLLVVGLAGCHWGLRTLDDPERNQAVRVANGDTIRFDLPENATTGYQWTAKSDDPDAEVRVVHVGPACDGVCGAPGKAEVSVHIHRGFDGPATVTLAYRRPWSGETAKEYRYMFYRRTGDVAFWK